MRKFIVPAMFMMAIGLCATGWATEVCLPTTGSAQIDYISTTDLTNGEQLVYFTLVGSPTTMVGFFVNSSNLGKNYLANLMAAKSGGLNVIVTYENTAPGILNTSITSQVLTNSVYKLKTIQLR